MPANPPHAPEPQQPGSPSSELERIDLLAVWLADGRWSRRAQGQRLLAELQRGGLSDRAQSELRAALLQVEAERQRRRRSTAAGVLHGLGSAALAGLVTVLLFRTTFSGVEQQRFDVTELAAVPDRFAQVQLVETPEDAPEPEPPPEPIVVSKEAPPEEAPAEEPVAEAAPDPDPKPVDTGPAKSAADAARKLAQPGPKSGIQGVETGNKEVMGDIADAFADVAADMDLEDAALDLDLDAEPVHGDGTETSAKKRAGGRVLKNVGGSGSGATWVSETEVTQREWTTVLGMDTRVTSGRWNLPVDQVSWCDALRFANGKSKKEGRKPAYRFEGSCEQGGTVHWDTAASGYRLLTQAEFAKLAATGGVSRRVSLYQNNKDLVDVDADAVSTPDGLKGMHDNAREWVWAGSGAGGPQVHAAATPRALWVGCRSGTDPKNICPKAAGPSTRRLGVGLRVARGPVRE